MKYHVELDIELRKNPYPGKFIAVEGVDGSGKTTQVKLLAEALEKKGIKTFVTKEPTDEVTGKLIREVLSGKIKIPQVAFQYLFAADRAIHQAEMEEYLKKGITVISDRYFWSSIVYGMVDKGIVLGEEKHEKDNLLVALSVLSMYHRFLVPDFSFCLTVPIGAILERMKAKDKNLEIYEKEDVLRKVEAGYKWLTEKFPKEITVIDGGEEVGKVTERIVASIK